MNRQVTKSKELQAFESLRGRMNFARDQKYQFQRAWKGYLGEKRFSTILNKNVKSSHIALYGLSFENKASWYQLDCLLIFPHIVYLIEVKNFTGEFILKEEHLYSYITEEEYRNPIHQLKRSRIFLRKLIPQLGVNLPIESVVVFVNQEFTLFHAERNPLIILPTQINSFIQKLNNEQGMVGTHHHQLTGKIAALHRTDSPYIKMPQYEYANLRKGILCRGCRRIMNVNYRLLSCPNCKYIESLDSGILRQIMEFNILFPEERITTGNIHHWISYTISRATLQRILGNKMKPIPNGKYSYYTFY